jgi:carbon monoxide dehydrogenase subunit G
MIEFEQEIFINRPQPEVFDFVSDPANDSRWQSGSEGGEWSSDGPVGVGSTVSSATKFLGRTIESTHEVTSWDPPNRLGQKAVTGPVPFEITISLEPKEGGTQVTVNGQAEFGGFFKVAEGLVGRQLKKQMASDFKSLKALLEA